MYVETRNVNGKRKYYLASSLRVGTKVVKVRVFLGTDLGSEEIKRLAEKKEGELEEKARSARIIGDPYRTVLSSKEMQEITLFTTRIKVKLAHLSEADWKNFTEEFTYHTNAIEGSTVSKREVKEVLSNEKWPEKSKEEIAETLGVAEAVKYLRSTKDALSLDLIKELHRI